MTCERYDDVLDDYVDGARTSGRPGEARLAAFESHLAGCERCQILVADFTSIRRTAADLDELLPPPRLWAKVASAIDEEEWRPWWQRTLADVFSAWGPVAVIAALILIVGGLTLLKVTPVPAPPQTAAAVAPAEPAIAPAEQHYEEAIAGLQRIADAQNTGLDPATRAVLQQNLAVVDRAINESRAALSDEPASALAQESLLDALDTKVALLQDTVALASEGGDVLDDAAPAVKELNQ